MKFKTLTMLSAALLLTLFVTVCFGTQEPPNPTASFPETSYEFSAVLDGVKVEHEFVIQNNGKIYTNKNNAYNHQSTY